MIIRGGLKRRVEERSTVPGITWAQYVRMQVSGGLADVSPEQGMRHPAVSACVGAIADLISSLPRQAVRSVGTVRVPLSTLPSLIAAPSGAVTWQNWVHQVVESWLLYGNAYGDIISTDSMMRPTQIETINGSVMTWRVVDGKQVVYQNGKQRKLWPSGDLWHVPINPPAGSIVGVAPFDACRTPLAVAIAIQRFAAEFFASGGNPTAIIKAGTDPGTDQAQLVKDRFIDMQNGVRAPIVLPSWMEYQQIQIKPNESQFIEAQQFLASQIAQAFRVRGTTVDAGPTSSGGSVTYQNRLDAMNELVTFTLRPYIETLESSVSLMLPQPQNLKIQVDGLLEANAPDRFDVYLKSAQVSNLLGEPLLSIDEMRALEDRAPLPPSAALPDPTKGSP